ncbi:siderophore-interacting protein [Szabonella alba]|uniref:Siderophore-interacting protein n=1 Tax=Szabonella alba TaxID=2804194 RepID=A0A8K0VC81_9RHOB|nr:siderophore-interacting protein [Szabonella alba]MBL4919031.1 siderophore-interacting protein [Szabonella alba]
MGFASTAQGTLSPVGWAEIEGFARNLSEFCKLHVTPDHVLTAVMEAGEIRLHWHAGRAGVRLSAQNDEGLQNLRDTLGYLLEVASEGLAAGLSWQEGPSEGQPPPNFRQARVLRSDRISPGFQRIRLAADALDFMARTGLHLRLLQPRDPAQPQWPRLAANGRTVWPGAGQLHMPVYTIRAIDAAAGWLEVDIFLHGKGPTCAWARDARPGDVVGLTGPGGGWLPDGASLCLGGDETALPVLARILETLPASVTGEVVIELGDMADRQALRAPPGINLHWLRRGRDLPLRRAFVETVGRMRGVSPGVGVVFGGEKSDAQTIRASLKEDAKGQGQTTVAAYWTASA